MQQITSTSDKLTKKNIINRISDVPGGISLAMVSLVVGAIVVEASALSAPVNGVRSVCKQAILLTGSSTTALVVATDSNQFKVGDNVMQAVGGACYAISTIVDNGDGTSTLTIPTALESAEAGTPIYQGTTVGAAAGELTNEADVILKEAFEVPAATQVIFIADAFVRADIVEGVVGALYLATLDVNEIKY